MKQTGLQVRLFIQKVDLKGELNEKTFVLVLWLINVEKGDNEMNINLIIFITSTKDQKESHRSEMMMKTVESPFRPVRGDIIDDPGFDARFHNGYEVVRVTVNYETNECYVSLQPLVLELEEISVYEYIDKLVANNWRIVSKEVEQPPII
jgi:hypothetical protein